MNRDRAEALAKSIKESYRRLEFGSNDIRIKQETDGLIDQLVAPYIIDDMVQRDQREADAMNAGQFHYDPIPKTVEGQLRILQCVEALMELVRLKNMKEHIEAMEAAGTTLATDVLLKREYEAGKDAAWARAREVLR